MNKLIQCADHSYAPWGIVCVHLVEHTALDWMPVPQEPGSECDNDWLCPTCLKKYPDVLLDDMRAICMHCIRDLKRGFGGSSQEVGGGM